MRKFLFTTTALVFCCGISQPRAACIQTPACTDMGYSSSLSCDGGLKCPFGNYWYCPENLNGGECKDFPYTCFGRGYLEGKGIGEPCNGKYVKCECYDGFEWQDGKGCVEITDCRVGSVFYSDNTCSMSLIDVDVKKPIGIVVYSDGKGYGQIAALEHAGYYTWGPLNDDVPGLKNYASEKEAVSDVDSCGNTAKLIAAGDKNKYPAAWAAHEYRTEETQPGDWCLPAGGVAREMFGYKFQRVGDLGSDYGDYWTSTEHSANDAFIAASSGAYSLHVPSKDDEGNCISSRCNTKMAEKIAVRPVREVALPVQN